MIFVMGMCLAVCMVLTGVPKTAQGKHEAKKTEDRRQKIEDNAASIENRKSKIENNPVRIETFAPEHGYIVGMENVVLLCVVRNTSSALLPENTLRLRCYPISGLDYTNGNLLPVLPALAPGQAVTYRWRFAPSQDRNALVAGVVLEPTEGERKKEKGESDEAQSAIGNRQSAIENTLNSQLAFAVVPRLARALSMGDVPVFKDPLAHAGTQGGTGLLMNGRVAVRAQITERRETGLILSVKDGNVWRTVAQTLALLAVCVGEEGQRPWRQTFRCQQMRASDDKTAATLTLVGMIGTACRAEITFESRPDTGVLNGKVRLTALRTLRISGIQLPALFATSDDKTLTPPRADGSPFLLPDSPALIAEDARIAAGHNGAATFGMAWPAEPPFPNWKWNRLPLADGLVTSTFGVQAQGEAQGESLAAGSSLEIPFRWFAFAPSDTVRDAQRFQMP